VIPADGIVESNLGDKLTPGRFWLRLNRFYILAIAVAQKALPETGKTSSIKKLPEGWLLIHLRKYATAVKQPLSHIVMPGRKSISTGPVDYTHPPRQCQSDSPTIIANQIQRNYFIYSML
jgi:hypothetical protein